MAGHSKWANIKHRKGAQDKKRGKLFSKFIREISAAVRMSGPEPSDNPRLRLVMDKAFAANMPKDTIDRAIKRASGEDESVQMESVRYEGYGPAGVAVMVECLTDNRNRTVADVRHAFTKCGGNLGTDGSVAYLFTRTGQLIFPTSTSEETLMDLALEANADDVVKNNDNDFELLISPDEVSNAKALAENHHLQPDSFGVVMRPMNQADIDDVETAEKLLRLFDMLEDLDDVQEVYSNANIDDDVLSKISE